METAVADRSIYTIAAEGQAGPSRATYVSFLAADHHFRRGVDAAVVETLAQVAERLRDEAGDAGWRLNDALVDVRHSLIGGDHG
jgi:hypothetical protein